MTVDWWALITEFSGPQHLLWAGMAAFVMMTFLVTAAKNIAVGVAEGFMYAAIFGFVSHAAWHQVFVLGEETYSFTVHCIWFNGLLSLAYVLLSLMLVRRALFGR
ncbi:MAG TPA: hypothetical protein VD862_02305 [Candidatus Paceibacterota bacterium]|nr:hypothetical protein [Candidatus Paceibacterota bacterium]